MEGLNYGSKPVRFLIKCSNNGGLNVSGVDMTSESHSCTRKQIDGDPVDQLEASLKQLLSYFTVGKFGPSRDSCLPTAKTPPLPDAFSGFEFSILFTYRPNYAIRRRIRWPIRCLQCRRKAMCFYFSVVEV